MRRKSSLLLLISLSYWTALQLTTLYRLTTSNVSPGSNRSSFLYPRLQNTLIHCVGDNFLESSWQYKSCHYRQLCWTDGEWTIHATNAQEQLEQGRLRWSSTSLQQQISTIGLRPQWIRSKEYRWSPKIKDMRSSKSKTSENVFTDTGVVLVISVPPVSKKYIFALLVDTLLPLYNLVNMFGLQNEKQQHISVHVLNSDKIEDKAVWKQGLAFMGYFPFQPPPSNNVSVPSHCVSHVAAGIGRLSGTGLTKRGYAADDYQTTKIRNHGKGLLLEKFRNHICQTLGIGLSETGTSNAIQLGLPLNHNLYLPLQKGLNLILDDQDVTSKDPKSLIELSSSSKLWITLAGDDAYTWPALFLPRNSHLVLLYDPNITVKTKKKQQNKNKAPVRQDFSIWSHVSHIKVHWLSISHDPETLIRIVKHLLIQSDYKEDTTVSGDNGETAIDGRFNEQPVRLKRYKANLQSQIHCMGDNWNWDAANHRSCHMQHICFDTIQRQFVMDLSEQSPGPLLPFDRLSTRVDNHKKDVMIGHSIRLGNGGPWSPDIRSLRTKNNFYYAFANNANHHVWLPFYPEQPNVNNPGHLLWDYWLPIYNLLTLFQLEDKPLLLTNVDPYCVENATDSKCYNIITKFLPLLGVDPRSFINTHNSQLVLQNQGISNASSSLVCARHGVAGIGMLTDHGTKKHGQLIEDYKTVHNIGRGGMFWDFRNFMLLRMEMSSPPSSSSRPYKITFSIHSSNNPSRRCGFEKQIQVAKQLYKPRNKYGVEVQTVVMGELNLKDQLSVVQESAVFISVMGGAASTAMFLEKDTTLILYYNDIDDFVKGTSKIGKMANRMDWDFFNNASYLRVHWLSIRSMDEDSDLDIFSRLLESEVESVLLLYSSKSL